MCHTICFSLAVHEMTVASQAPGPSTSAVAPGPSTSAVAPADTALQRSRAPLSQALDDEMQDDRLLSHDQEDVGLPVGEDVGLPVQRQTPIVTPTTTTLGRRHWLTKLKSCADAEDVLATLDELRKAIPRLDKAPVQSTRSSLVELLQASTLSGKQYKKKRKLITKSSRKVLSSAVKQAFPKKLQRKL